MTEQAADPAVTLERWRADHRAIVVDLGRQLSEVATRAATGQPPVEEQGRAFQACLAAVVRLPPVPDDDVAASLASALRLIGEFMYAQRVDVNNDPDRNAAVAAQAAAELAAVVGSAER